MEGLNLTVVHIATAVSSKGHDNGKMVGGMAAVAIHGLTVGVTFHPHVTAESASPPQPSHEEKGKEVI